MSKPCDFAHVLGYGHSLQSVASLPDDDMSLKQFAQTDFEPWDSTQKTFPTPSEWASDRHQLHFALTLATALLCKPKSELMKAVESMASEGMLQGLLETLQHAKEGFGHFRDACAAAEARLYVAGHALVQNMQENA